jgi:DNA repair exonuclease SbcCD ATPase subunit
MQAQKEKRECERLAHEAGKLLHEYANDLDELREEMEGLQAILQKIQTQRAIAVERERGLRNYRTARKGAQSALDDARKRLKTQTALLAKAEAREAVLRTVAAVFGMKGFRAQVLGDALGGIELLANTWLSMLSGEASLVLVNDVKGNIAINVDGFAGGQGYKGASTGEKRRLDVALLLALSEVAAGAQGCAPGTLFLDEVFDGLDPRGREGVCSVLEALSADRGIVVITHDTSLQGMVGEDSHVEL